MDSLQDVPKDINGWEDEFWPLSGKSYFNVILKKTHVKPRYILNIPAKMTTLLPPVNVPMLFTYRGKEWETRYEVVPRKGHNWTTSIIKWKEFVIDNHLKEGDACVFELSECSNTLVRIRVQILRGDFPSQLLNRIDGLTPDKPIII